MCSFGDLSGQIAPLTNSVGNPSSGTLFSLDSGGDAVIPMLASEMAGRLLRITVVGNVTFGSSTNTGAIGVYAGDPTTPGTGIGPFAQVHKPGSSPFYAPLAIDVLAFWDATLNKYYYIGDTENSDPFNPNVSNTSSSGSLSSATVMKIYIVGLPDVQDAGTTIAVSEFKVSLA